MAVLSTKSFFTRDTNNSTRTYARAADNASYKYYNNITWSMWLAIQPGSNKNLWSMWETLTGAKRSWLFSAQDDGTFRTIFSWDGTNFSLHKTTNPIFTYEWINLVVSFASGTQTVYVNTVAQTMVPTIAWGGGAAGLNAANVQLLVSSEEPSAPVVDKGVGGCLNNYSMWSKVLSASERTELYNNGIPGDLAAHSAVANLTNWWRMDQTDTAPTLIDAKNGSASNMTITKSGTNPFFDASNNHAKIYSVAPTADEIATAVLAGVIETGYTLKNSMRLMLSALAGKISGAPTTSVVIRNVTDSKARITATVDANGNRTAVTHDVTD